MRFDGKERSRPSFYFRQSCEKNCCRIECTPDRRGTVGAEPSSAHCHPAGDEMRPFRRMVEIASAIVSASAVAVAMTIPKLADLSFCCFVVAGFETSEGDRCSEACQPMGCSAAYHRKAEHELVRTQRFGEILEPCRPMGCDAAYRPTVASDPQLLAILVAPTVPFQPTDSEIVWHPKDARVQVTAILGVTLGSCQLMDCDVAWHPRVDLRFSPPVVSSQPMDCGVAWHPKDAFDWRSLECPVGAGQLHRHRWHTDWNSFRASSRTTIACVGRLRATLVVLWKSCRPMDCDVVVYRLMVVFEPMPRLAILAVLAKPSQQTDCHELASHLTVGSYLWSAGSFHARDCAAAWHPTDAAG
mmetsp:Transcript_20730/g.59061  ORF Transcript_20730/g.59061 Transcript_20730/m.59061 type:complete len:357 (-) Transcript_20730:583-1653(-)